MSNDLELFRHYWVHCRLPADFIADLADTVEDDEYSADKRAHQIVLRALDSSIHNPEWREVLFDHTEAREQQEDTNKTDKPEYTPGRAGTSLRYYSDEGQTNGVIKNHLRDFKPEDIDRELAKMVENKWVEAFKGARSVRYRLKK